MKTEESFAFVCNLLDVKCDLPIEIIPRHFFDKATDSQIDHETRDTRQGARGSDRPRTNSEKRNELFNDPAVKTVLIGLDATITGIETS